MTVYVVTWYDLYMEGDGIASIFHTREGAVEFIANHKPEDSILLDRLVEEFEVQ